MPPKPDADDFTGPRKDDPDVGPTKATPSVGDQLDKTELATRALRLRHIQQQTKMVDEANAMTRYPREEHGK